MNIVRKIVIIIGILLTLNLIWNYLYLGIFQFYDWANSISIACDEIDLIEGMTFYFAGPILIVLGLPALLIKRLQLKWFGIFYILMGIFHTFYILYAFAQEV